MTLDVKALSAGTPPDEIKQRQGPGGKRLDYVDARFVMDRLDSAVGPENWQDRYEDAGTSVRCGIGIRLGDEWVWKWDVGDPSDIEPTKGAHSDAFKRAGVKWGIARDLYGDHAAPQRPQAVRPQPSATPTPVARPQAPTGDVGLTPRQFFDAADNLTDRKTVSDVARDLFGQWQVTALTPEQRAHLLEELRHQTKKEPEPEWAGVA